MYLTFSVMIDFKDFIRKTNKYQTLKCGNKKKR